MPADCISYKNTGFYSSLICDYLEEKDEIKTLYNRFPTLDNFRKQIEEKAESFPIEFRSFLASELKKQYSNIGTSELTNRNIDALSQENTFTITTGHQYLILQQRL